IAADGHNQPLRIPDEDGPFVGLKVTVFLEVEGAAHYLPSYAGNLDIMTSAALATAERIASRAQGVPQHDLRSHNGQAIHPGRDAARR
ncbi:hypothetical protein ACKYQE_13835, partial [Enterococcus faecium]